MGSTSFDEHDEHGERQGVTFLQRRPKPAVFAAPVVMALWKQRVFEAFQPPEAGRDLGRTA